MKLYHYKKERFEEFDTSKCDGIWLTDIDFNNKSALEEVGAHSFEWVAVCEADTSNSALNGSNHDVEEQILIAGADCIENRYDGFTDYAFADSSKVKILEWIKL